VQWELGRLGYVISEGFLAEDPMVDQRGFDHEGDLGTGKHHLCSLYNQLKPKAEVYPRLTSMAGVSTNRKSSYHSSYGC
jgi:hypothetical protein